jgi:hypothetical protein
MRDLLNSPERFFKTLFKRNRPISDPAARI